MSYARRHSINVCPGNRVRYSGIGEEVTDDICEERFVKLHSTTDALA